MIAINIIQYKFRNDLLDDLEYSSQTQHNLNNNNCSDSSLDNTMANDKKKNSHNENEKFDDDDNDVSSGSGNSNKHSGSNGQLLYEKMINYGNSNDDNQVKIKLGCNDDEHNQSVCDNTINKLRKPGHDLNEIIFVGKEEEAMEENDSYLDGYEDEDDADDNMYETEEMFRSNRNNSNQSRDFYDCDIRKNKKGSSGNKSNKFEGLEMKLVNSKPKNYNHFVDYNICLKEKKKKITNNDSGKSSNSHSNSTTSNISDQSLVDQGINA